MNNRKWNVLFVGFPGDDKDKEVLVKEYEKVGIKAVFVNAEEFSHELHRSFNLVVIFRGSLPLNKASNNKASLITSSVLHRKLLVAAENKDGKFHGFLLRHSTLGLTTLEELFSVIVGYYTSTGLNE